MTPEEFRQAPEFRAQTDKLTRQQLVDLSTFHSTLSLALLAEAMDRKGEPLAPPPVLPAVSRN